MVAEITLTLMARAENTAEQVQPYLDQFESQARVHVRLQIQSWEEGRADLNRIAFAHQGPDVSEVGTTWVNDLVAMNALRPYNALEVNQMGRKEGFLEAAWESSMLPGDPQTWAIPWTAEVFLMHYRKDLLADAGLEPQTALASPEAITDTTRILKDKLGLDVPVGLPLRLDRYGNMHCLAPYLWYSGTHFMAEDGRTILFNEPEAIRAIAAYYGLLKYCSPEGLKQLNEVGAWALFRAGKAAVSFGSQGMTINRDLIDPAIVNQVGAVGFHPSSFVGGSDLVIWNHTRYPSAAVELVRFLTGESVQLKVVPALNSLPARLSALDSEAFHSSELMTSLAQALKNGRAYPAVPLWGMMEERLSVALSAIWDNYYANPTDDLETLIRQGLDPLAKRLSVTFAQYKK